MKFLLYWYIWPISFLLSHLGGALAQVDAAFMYKPAMRIEGQSGTLSSFWVSILP